MWIDHLIWLIWKNILRRAWIVVPVFNNFIPRLKNYRGTRVTLGISGQNLLKTHKSRERGNQRQTKRIRSRLRNWSSCISKRWCVRPRLKQWRRSSCSYLSGCTLRNSILDKRVLIAKWMSINKNFKRLWSSWYSSYLRPSTKTHLFNK